MSGPPYPRSGAAFDYWSTVISQYANSRILTQLVQNFFEYLDPTANLQSFYNTIWNIDTAIGYGLDVWGRIVGVRRTLQVQVDDVYWGFQESTTANARGWNQAPFYSGAPITDNFDLSDDAFRVLIFVKALANISDGSIPAINQLLLNLFPDRGNCYVADNNDMTCTYTFEFALTPVEQAIVQASGVLPTPTGVKPQFVFS